MIDDFQPRRPQAQKLEPISVPGPHPAIQAELKQPKSKLDDIEIIELDDTPAPAAQPVKQKRVLPVWLNYKAWTKKQWTIAIIVLALLLSVIGGAVYGLVKPDAPAPVAAAPAAPTAKPEPILSPLTGLVVSADQAKLPVTGIMVENSQDARPQSGLDKAGVVYEAIAEGGITRFLALYQEGDPDYVGPVRSVRPYYLDWLTGNDAAIAHVGGSPEALAKIKSTGIKDLDQFSAAGSYSRIGSRSAPHNVYTSLARLRELGNGRGYTTSNFQVWQRKADTKAATLSATSIDFAISSALYNVHYDYDAADNSYHRSEGGKPHMIVDSAGTQTQLKPKVVVSLVTSKSLQADNKHYDYNTIGSGAVYIYQDGGVTIGTWNKPDAKTNISFTDSAGKTIALNAGQTWISVVDAVSDIASK